MFAVSFITVNHQIFLLIPSLGKTNRENFTELNRIGVSLAIFENVFIIFWFQSVHVFIFVKRSGVI